MKKQGTIHKTAAILTIIFASFYLLLSISFISVSSSDLSKGYSENFTYEALITMLVIGIIFLLIALTQITLSSIFLMKLTEKKYYSGILLTIVILSFLCFNLITLIVGSIALAQGNPAANSDQQIQQDMTSEQQDDFRSKIAKFKQYKEDGIITEEVYKEKVEELLKKEIES